VLHIATNRHPFDRGPNVLKAKEYKPKDGSDPGPRIRVYYSDVREIHLFKAKGWARHVPPEVWAMYMVVACQWHSRIAGDLMWFNIKDLYPKTLKNVFAGYPPGKKEEVIRRFCREYGKPYKATVRGLVKVLVDLGLVKRYWDSRGEGLRIPEELPWPSDTLVLDEKELRILEWRKRLTHTSYMWLEPDVQERAYL
jgi:hypothetical protein